MLVKAIRNRLYLPPHQAVPPLRQEMSLAPRIKTEDKIMDFQRFGRHEICQRFRALGPLHAFVEHGDGRLRIKCDLLYTAMDVFQLVDEIRDFSRVQSQLRNEVAVGVPYAFVQRDTDVMACPDHLLVNTEDGTVYIGEITVEGKQAGPAVQRAAQAKLFAPPHFVEGCNEWDCGSMFYKFLKPLIIE